MTESSRSASDEASIAAMHEAFALQRSRYSPAGAPTFEERVDRLNRIERLTKEHVEEIGAALQSDFGSRSPDWSFNADIYPQLAHVQFAKRHLRRWMRKRRTSSGWLSLTGQRTYIVNEPLGVVGIMSPFNAPVSLTFDPAVDAIAAGNSVMIKMSENTPRTAQLIQSLAQRYFEPQELSVVVGGPEVSKAFAALAWDKLLFTGGSEVGKRILAAAAPNLTPVILELGGKSPCLVLEDAKVEEVARKVARVRQLNAGQVCISVDYVLLPAQQLEDFIAVAQQADREAYPEIVENEAITSIINDAAYERIVGSIKEAKQAGCRVIESTPPGESLPDPLRRKIPLTIVVNPPPDLALSRQETFGPVLVLITYERLEEAIARINANEKPLAMYVFGRDRTAIEQVLNSTSCGGVTVNDLMMHAASETMGFGGVGYSGMGRYKGGLIGYEAFSNQKAVFEQGLMGRFTEIFFPPYRSERARNALRRRVGVR